MSKIDHPTYSLPNIQKITKMAPKKSAPMAYNVFLRSKMAELRAAEPGLDYKEYMSKVSDAWNNFKVANDMPVSSQVKYELFRKNEDDGVSNPKLEAWVKKHVVKVL